MPDRPTPAILMFHRIADESFDPWGTIVSPGRFAEQLDWIANKRTVLRLEEFADLHRMEALPRDAIAITFDDGYSCSADIAAPRLNELRLPATIFLPVEWIERGEQYWWDEIQDIVFDHDGPSLRLGERSIELGGRLPEDAVWTHGKPPQTPRQVVFRELTQELLWKTPAQTEESMDELRQQFDGKRSRKRGQHPLSREQIRSTANSKIAFGSHALAHPTLTSLDANGQAHEICDSVARCEALTGFRPATFAYPYGVFDERSVSLVEEAGFVCACAALPGRIDAHTSIYELPRLQVGNWSAGELECALAVM